MHAVSNRISPWFLALVGVAAVGGVLAVIGTPEALAAGSSALLTAGVVVLVLAGWAVSLCLHEFGTPTWPTGPGTVRSAARAT